MSSKQDKVALITGSTSGIGLAIAQALARKGYHVVLHSRQSVATGTSLAAALPSARYVAADLLQEEARRQLIDAVLAHYGRLDVLVNNAGASLTIPHNDLDTATPDLWHQQYELHVVAPWQLIALSRDALAAGAAKGVPGTVVNIASHAGLRPKGASIPYAVSKAALIHMTKLLAKTLAPQIRVNALAPGLVDTPLTAGWSDIRNQWRRDAPMGRGAQPEEIAHMALALIESPYLTGEVILLDGGMHLL